MDLLRISHYLAWNYWKTIWLNPNEFISVVEKYYNPPKSRDYFSFTLQSSGKNEVFFYSCLKDIDKDILINCVNELNIPLEFQDLSNLIKTKQEKVEDEKEKLKKLRLELDGIKWWTDEASKFHKTVKEILDLILKPNLVNWKIEQEVLEWIKRIDILYENNAIYGFFNWLNYLKKVDCPFIPIECKNYWWDIKNPEIDQLIWRFWKAIWRFWILIANTITPKQKTELIKKLNKNYSDDKWFVIYFDKKEINEMIDLYLENNEEWISNKFMERFKEIIL